VERGQIVIEKTKGTKKFWLTSRGRIEMPYPLDYGYLHDIFNPDDNAQADVFVGTAGDAPNARHGYFIKGRVMPEGEVVYDELKWFVGLSDEEYDSLRQWWYESDPGVTWGWTELPSRFEVVKHAFAHSIR